MKKFSFSLENVLNYNHQVLDNLKNEHAAILEQIERQKKKIEEVQQQYVDCGQQMKEEARKGITIQQMNTYENYLYILSYQIKKEQDMLKVIYKQEEMKRQQVIEAKRESASVEKLRENKFEIYNKELQKEQELLMEEFVSFTRSRRNAVG